MKPTDEYVKHYDCKNLSVIFWLKDMHKVFMNCEEHDESFITNADEMS